LNRLDVLSRRNYDYWLKRAGSYSKVNQDELLGVQRQNWSNLLDEEIRDHFNIEESERSRLKILDIGAGPGFISIILSKLGYNVTAVDFSQAMLDEARANADHEAKKITFKQENALNLTFEDSQFDVVLSRNLTWNLSDPKTAYSEWIRVLKQDGCMMVFDANWYAYLEDEESYRLYEQDRENSKAHGEGDYNIGENFDIMEDIARVLPLTGKNRPEWDEKVLNEFNVKDIKLVEDIGSQVYSEKERVNYASTPMFMIKVRK
jgi:SAM-dependent methyltransferase